MYLMCKTENFLNLFIVSILSPLEKVTLDCREPNDTRLTIYTLQESFTWAITRNNSKILIEGPEGERLAWSCCWNIYKFSRYEHLTSLQINPIVTSVCVIIIDQERVL